MEKEIQEKVDSLLGEFDVSFDVKLVGETVRENNWHCDAWKVTFSKPATKRPITATFETDYFTGLGHRKGNVKNKDSILYMEKPQTPRAADVLYSLLLDMQARDECFDDWCSEFSYNSDSIKALSIYQQCCEIGKKMCRVFSRSQIEQLKNVLQDH